MEVIEVQFEEHAIENRQDYDDFVRDSEKRDLDFGRKNLGGVSILDSRYLSRGYFVVYVEVVEGIDLFNGDILK